MKERVRIGLRLAFVALVYGSATIARILNRALREDLRGQRDNMIGNGQA